MAPRMRSRRNRDLPDNLYYTLRSDGRRYFEYRHPVTGKRHGMGYDKTEAVSAARQLNGLFGAGRDLVAKVAGGRQESVTLGEYVAHYRTEVMPSRRVNGKPLSQRYIEETNRILDRIEEHLGRSRPMVSITQGDLAAYLNAIQSADACNQHRVRLVQLWKHAVSDEVVPENLAEKILARDSSEKVRRRLTLEWYQAIYPHARRPIQNAMELSLNALQRRADVHKWRFEDQREGHAFVIQQKTRKHGPSAWLRIPLALPVAYSAAGAETLGDIIEGCRDDILCPFLVHDRPQRIRRARDKEHPFQLSLRDISDGFADARDATGLFDEMDARERPTFHELLSLGEHLRQEQGWEKSQIRELKGHTSVQMTEHYLEGHTWTTVEIPRNLRG